TQALPRMPQPHTGHPRQDRPSWAGSHGGPGGPGGPGTGNAPGNDQTMQIALGGLGGRKE
ncbi:hypothetical protein N4P33_33585, partial [Streptomyces sp. 15-116A]|uniref:hypothetical protein n=1 Tax=Streptomyces sp. 15-116A TaxID=2259035 RepID=UPI0021B4239B